MFRTVKYTDYIKEAKSEFDQKKYGSALEKYQTARCFLDLNNPNEKLLNILCNEAACYKYLENWKNAFLSLFQVLIYDMRDSNAYSHAIRNLENYCVILKQQGVDDKTIQNYFLTAFKELKVPPKILEIFITGLRCYEQNAVSSMSNMYAARTLCFLLIDEYEEYNEKAKPFSHLSGIELQKGNYEEALKFAKAAHDIKETAESHRNLAYVYIELCDRGLAFFHIQRAIELDKEGYKDLHLKSQLLLAAEKFEQALEASLKMKQLFDEEYPTPEVFHYPLLSEHYRSLAFIFFKQGEIKKSVANFIEAINYNKNPLEFRTHVLLAYMMLEQKNYQASKSIFTFLIEKHQEKGLIAIPEQSIYRGLGFSLFYLNEVKESMQYLQMAFKVSNDLYSAIGLYDACLFLYKKTNDISYIKKATALCFNAEKIPFFQEATTKIPVLYKKASQESSYVAVYIWSPLSEEDPGHAALKVVHQGKSFYFSWFPSGDNYENTPGTLRATPQFYGRKHHKKDELLSDDRAEMAKLRVSELFNGNFPENSDMQIKDLLRRGSDKGELRKSATYKIIFYEGINPEKLLEWWRHLLASNEAYGARTKNCCDVVLYSLQYALEEKFNLSSIKTSKMVKNNSRDTDNILFSHKFKTSDNNHTTGTLIYKYCYRLGYAINNTEHNKNMSVIIRFNRWDKKTDKIIAFDFDPTKFDPNPKTRTKKMKLPLLFAEIINHSFSNVLFSSSMEEKDVISQETSTELMTMLGLFKSSEGSNDSSGVSSQLAISTQSESYSH